MLVFDASDFSELVDWWWYSSNWN